MFASLQVRKQVQLSDFSAKRKKIRKSFPRNKIGILRIHQKYDQNYIHRVVFLLPDDLMEPFLKILLVINVVLLIIFIALILKLIFVQRRSRWQRRNIILIRPSLLEDSTRNKETNTSEMFHRCGPDDKIKRSSDDIMCPNPSCKTNTLQEQPLKENCLEDFELLEFKEADAVKSDADLDPKLHFSDCQYENKEEAKPSLKLYQLNEVDSNRSYCRSG